MHECGAWVKLLRFHHQGAKAVVFVLEIQ